jgi:RHS repeat-associated protein
MIVAVAMMLAVSSCRSNTVGDNGNAVQIASASALPVGAAASASQIVAAIQAQPGSPVQSAVAQGFSSAAAGLQPQFAAATLAGESKPAQVVLPALCNSALHLQDTTSGAAIDVTLKGALPVAAQTASGYVVYPAALAGGAVLHRALPSGSEDFVTLPTRLTTPEIDYSVALGKGVAGLRLVGGTLEMLDASGTPRLRVAPPYIVGADGMSTDGALAVTDCFVDSDPTPPWGRTVTDPGATSCTVRVTWPDASVVYPAILDPRWTTTGSMIAARYEHSLTLIASTGEVLAAGGRSSTSSTTALASAEIYNKTTGVWTSTNPMANARRLHAATQLGTSGNPTTSAKILVSGGISGSTSLTSAELYTRSTGLWSAAGSLNTARHLHTATLLADGRVLVAGGMNGTATIPTAALYNPASGSGSWVATTGPIPPTGWRYGTATLIQTTNNQLNNHVLLVAGNNGTSTISAVYLFDPVQNAFSTLASIPSPSREQHFAAVLPNSNGKILVGGGLNGSQVLGSAIVFDPSVSNGTWSSAGTMTSLRVGASAVVLPTSIVANGSVIVAGGSATGSTPLSSAELFSGTSTWTATPSMPGPLQGSRAVLLGTNMILVAGGLSSSTTVQNAAYLYDASFGLGCSSNSQCASGFCANGICCDSSCTGTCGACNLAGHLGTCTPLSNGTVCRAASGACDVAETCNGSALTCPADAVQPLGAVCRSAVTICDVPETCDGTTKACPTDQFASATTVCYASTGICDATETCTGTSSTCPVDTFAPATTICRPSAGGCDVAETCTGTSAVCPPDGLAAAGTVCRPAESVCDVAETCSGTTAACPTDTFATAGTTCGAGSPAPVCSGSTGTCPVSGGTSDILGFEALADWAFDPSAIASIVGLNPNRTEGAFSLEVTAQNSARLNSAPMNSIGGVNPTFLLDMELPTSQANPSSYGDVQMLVNSPSLGISNVSLGDVGLTGLALGTWETLAFQMPASTANTIAHAVYSDLTFSIVLNVASAETGHYLLDNIRSMPDVIPSLLGIAQDGSGTKAIFDYVTTSSTPVTIPYGTGNGLTNSSGFVTSPTQTPPTTFVSTTHAPFVATLSGAVLTWTVGSHSATATANSQQLATTTLPDGTHDATLEDGRKVSLDSTPPASPPGVQGPAVGAEFNGVLTGQFAVSPSGAATYTVPISIPPGVAGMAPNLSLGYSSQAADGIAGQGWSLGGLSMITRCPRTRQQDGYGRPVMMDSLTDAQNNQDGKTDGVCLDGEKLFDTSPGTGSCSASSSVVMCYTPEKKDFSTITYDSTGEFQIVTKAGETRYYGLQTYDRVNDSGGNTAVWMLDRVVDGWGNYFDFHYNNCSDGTCQANFTGSGIWVSEIDYTGSLGGAQGGAIDPSQVNKVTFGYECRPDIRWTRFASLKIPQNQRLTSIGTSQGTYTLTYASPAPEAFSPGGCATSQPSLDLSELQTIGYCAGATCTQQLTSLTFGWQGGRVDSWTGSRYPGYALPSFVAAGKGLRGTQFIDIDGDGRSDFVLARANGNGGAGQDERITVLNTGSTWGSPLSDPDSIQTFPVDLSDDNDNPTGVRFADLNGDGRPDIIVDFANVTCANGVCTSCPVNKSCGPSKPYSPAVWLNTFTPGGQSGGWEFHGEFGIMPPSQNNDAITQPNAINFTSEFPATVGDVNGDGLSDLVLVAESTLGRAEVDVLLNSGLVAVGQNDGTGQQTPWTLQMVSSPGYSGSIPRLATGLTLVQMQLQDVNRDGLPDLFSFGVDPAGTVQGPPTTLINTSSGNNVSFGPPIPSAQSPQNAQWLGYPQSRPSYADIDGDGFYDFVSFFSSAFGSDTNAPGTAATIGLGNGTGWGFVDQYTGPYLQVLNALSPSVQKITDPLQAQSNDKNPGSSNPIVDSDDEDFGFNLADINGDGLVDLIRYHENAGPAASGQGGIEVLYNTGTTWLDPDGITSWQSAIGPSGIQAVAPSAISDIANIGSAFVDLNGDGFADLIQEEAGDQGFAPDAWLNPSRAPVISTFPNGLAASTTANYVNITSQLGAATYKDDDQTKPYTKLLAVPLLVVSNTLAADGTGTGSLNKQTFTYHSLRQDTNGRGPLGFDRVEVQDQASNTLTVTRYAQVYPYTGLPAQVDKYQLTPNFSHQYLMSETVTTYCDGTVPNEEFECGEDFGHGQPGGLPLFVFPGSIVDTTYLHPEVNDALAPPLGDTTDAIVTTSQFQYDDFGNAQQTTTTTTKTEHCTADKATAPCATEQFSKTVANVYTTTAEQQQGKPYSTVVTATGGTKNTMHTTTFEYATADTFGGSPSWLALTKTHVEPSAVWPIRLDTAYAYDRFGNLVTTTSCASDFDSCNATNPPTVNPSGSSDPVHHPPFRTTSVSYDPAVLGVSVTYGPGRFPTRTTDPAGHSATTVYDPVLGAVLTKTDPNGIVTCYTYDALGRQLSETDRCNSSAPLITTTDRRLAAPDPTAKVVTVVTPPSRDPVWTLADDQGHVVETVTGGFDGSLIETRTVHDAMGRVSQQSKPFVSTDQPFFTVTVPDSFNRVSTVTDPLGVIDSSGVQKSTTITTTYNGSSIQTQRTIDRPGGPVNPVTEIETETKNAIGKVQSEGRSTETGTVTTSYAYDADGNVTATTDPVGNQILIRYDTRGRKQTMSDPDMGNWTYTQDGFGDLVEQLDPNALKLDPNTTGTTMTYDPLGRILTKTTPTEGTAQWLYDVGAGAGVGQLAAMVSAPDPRFLGDCATPSGFAGLSGTNRAVKAFSYDQFGEMQQVAECADGTNFTTSYTYDPLGRQSQIRYPVVNSSQQLAVGYHYTSLGFLQYLTDDSTDYSVLWQAISVNALGQVLDEQMRNGVETVSTRNPLTGWLLGTTATAHADNQNVIQNWSYEFDEIGDLLTRTRADAVNPLTSQETFTYDLTNRLLTASGQTSGGASSSSWSNSYSYDAVGNLSQKDGQTYNYGTSAGCAAGPHAVCSVAGGTLYIYDANGNMTSTGSRTVTYNAANKVTNIHSDPTPSQGNDTGTVDLLYGADANRVVQSQTSGSTTVRTVYVGLGGTGKSLFEQTTTQTSGGAPTVQNIHYIYAGGVHGGNAFAVRVIDDDSGIATKYYSFDHLGSVTAVSDEEGRVSTSSPEATVLAYDVWGARRNPDESAASWQSFTPPVGNREFTGQEQIPDTGLVNMNGRVYDPALGRFLSPDPNVQDTSDTQSYNRYSYALNNPLRYTDPTGDVSWGGFWNSVKSDAENPMYWAEAGVFIAACATGPAGCLAFGLESAVFNAGVSLMNGASYEQTAINLGIGVGVAIVGYNADPSGPLEGLINGSASAAATTALTNRVNTGKWGGDDILAAAFMSAAEGAAMMGIVAVANKISQASAGHHYVGLDGSEGSGDEEFDRAMAFKQRAILSGNVTYGSVGDLPVAVYGGDEASRASSLAAIQTDLATPRGQQILDMLTTGPGAEAPFVKPYEVMLMQSSFGTITFTAERVTMLDPRDLGMYYSSDPGAHLFSEQRIFAHELGHLAGGEDDGVDGMANVNANENLIMKQMNDLFPRTELAIPQWQMPIWEKMAAPQ